MRFKDGTIHEGSWNLDDEINIIWKNMTSSIKKEPMKEILGESRSDKLCQEVN